MAAAQPGTVVKLVAGYKWVHWAVKVGDTWYEVRSDKHGATLKLKIDIHTGAEAAHGCKDIPSCISRTGKTTKSRGEILQWVSVYERNYGGKSMSLFSFRTTAKHFASELMEWLLNGVVLPCTTAQVAAAQPTVVKLVKGRAWFHWAVKVGDTWYEVGSDPGGKTLRIDIHTKAEALYGCKDIPICISHKGKTTKSEPEIHWWVSEYKRKFGGKPESYHLLLNNCQYFAVEFVAWLTNGEVKPWTWTPAILSTSPIWYFPALGLTVAAITVVAPVVIGMEMYNDLKKK